MARYSKINSFNALQTLTVGSTSYQIFSLARAAQTSVILNDYRSL
jgi:aconitate hydratase